MRRRNVSLRRQQLLLWLVVLAGSLTLSCVSANQALLVSFSSIARPPQSLAAKISGRNGGKQDEWSSIFSARNNRVALEETQTPLSSTKRKYYKTRWPLSALGYNNLSSPGLILLSTAIYMSLTNFATIPKRHFAFAVVYPIYLGIINRIRFQCNQTLHNNRKSKLHTTISLLWQGQGTWFKRYLFSFGLVGLILPCVFCGIAPAKEISQPAISHTILILAQVITEEMSTGPWMHMLPRLLVPIGFNTYRMGVLLEWVQGSWGLVNRHMSFWTVFGLALGIVNLIMWTYNLFVFLLLRVTPQYWDDATFPTSKVIWQGQLWPKVVDDEQQE